MKFPCGGSVSGNLSRQVLIYVMVLIFSLIVASSAVYAAHVDIWMNKKSYSVGERATVYFDFPRSGSYTLIQIRPRRETILRNQRAREGRNRMGGTIERPTGRKTLKVIFEDRYGNRSSATTSYTVRGGGNNDGGNGGSERVPLSYFRRRDPSNAGNNVTGSIQNEIQIIRPGDSSYRDLKRQFESKSNSLDLSRERQNLDSFSFSFGGSGMSMDFSIDPEKQNYFSLERSLESQGVSFFGSRGNENYFMIDPDPHPDPGPNPTPGRCGRCIVRMPCSCMWCCQPIFICLPNWVPWPLPAPWITWVITIAAM